MESSTPEDNADQSCGTTSNTETDACDTCKLMQDIEETMFLWFLLLSVIITIGLSFTVRRKNYRLSCCWGRPGFLQPVNFIDEVYRRWAYAACFVILTNDILGLFADLSHFNLLSTQDEEWMSKFGWVKVFVILLEALAVSLVYYPLLACINHRRSIAANVLGVFYLFPWITIYSFIFYFCPIRRDKSFSDNVQHVVRIPIYIAFYIVGLSYVLDFVRNIRRRRNLRNNQSILETKSSDTIEGNLGSSIAHHFEYAANLLRPRKPEQINETENVVRRKLKQLIKRVKYDKIMGFRYSTRLVCCTTIATTMLIWVVVATAAWIETQFQSVSGLCKEVSTAQQLSLVVEICDYIIHVAKISLHISNAVAGFVVLFFMVNTLVTYKRRWHQLLRGDHSWHMYGSTINSPSSTLLNGLKYAGFQVAYAVWGWSVLFFVLSIALVFLAFAFVVPLLRNWLVDLLKNYWPTLLLLIVIAVMQRLICRFIFLQDKGSLMALDNRRIYNTASYYFLVLNVIVGFFSCLKRILIPFILGILFLSRLDQPLVLKGYETLDPGYVSFVSMLLVDLHHNHPVVKAFVELMLKVRQQEQPFTGVTGEGVIQSEEKLRRSKLIRNRWWKTVTLANNPSLVLEVLEQRLKDERKNSGQTSQSPNNVGDSLRSIEMRPLPENYGEQSSFA